MKPVRLLSILLMALFVCLSSVLLALVVSPIAYSRNELLWKVVLALAILMMTGAPLMPHFVRLRFFRQPLSFAELASATVLSLATPFVFLTVFRRLVLALVGLQLSTSVAAFVLVAGSISTALGATYVAITLARFAAR